MKGVINGWMTRVRCHQVQWTFMCLVQLRLLMRFARWTGQFRCLIRTKPRLAKLPGTPYPSKQKGPECWRTLTPGMGWFFKGLPSGKRFSTYLPDGDPQRCWRHCWGSLHSIGFAFSSGFYPWASLPDGRTRPTGPLSSPAWADGTSAVCLATCLLSIPACLRRGATVSQVKT